MRQAVVLDTDIGTNPDDFFSILILLNAKNIGLKLVITGNNFPEERAKLAAKIVSQADRQDVKVVAGESTGKIEFHAEKFIGGSEPLPSRDYKEELRQVIEGHERVTYICVQGLSNLAAFLKEYPAASEKLDVVHMGLATNVGDGHVGGGTNIEADPLAARFVYEYGLSNFKCVGPQTTINDRIRVHPDTELFKRIAVSTDPNHVMLHRHLLDFYERRGIWPALHDPLATSVALGESFVTFETVSVQFEDVGTYRVGSGSPVLCSAVKIQDPDRFMEWCAELCAPYR